MSGRRRCILMIDDHENTRTGLSSLLGRRIDADILTASGGAEGIKQIRKAKPDLILLDLEMPVVSGYDVLEQLRREEIRTRVIVLSGNSEIETVVRCVRAGACDYLAKPAEIDVIHQHIERALVLESAANLLVADAPGSIQLVLNRIDQDLMGAKIEAAKIELAAQATQDQWERKFAFRARIVYVVLAAVTVWAMRGLDVIDRGGGSLVFLFFLVVFLLLPIERVRELFVSAAGSKGEVKIDPPQNS